MNGLFAEPSLDDICLEAEEILVKAKERFSPVATFALFSGGNDSTAMLHLVRNHIDAVVHIRTGIGIPETSEFVRETCQSWNLPLIELATDPSVYVNKIVLGKSGNGFPGPRGHHITYHRLKSERLQELQRDKTKRGERILFVTGVRSAESRRRMLGVGSKAIDDPRGRLTRCAWVKPIIGFTQAHLVEYRERLGVMQSPVAALIHKSGECLCGAFAQKGDLQEIEFWFPKTGAYIRSIEQEAEKAGKPYCRWGWGHDKRVGVPAPGPLCQGCSLFSVWGDGVDPLQYETARDHDCPQR